MGNKFKLSTRSLDNLKGVHPDLVAVMHRAILITPIDYCIIEGVRAIERQEMLVKTGASTTMNSRHLTGHAIDAVPFVGGEISWHWPHYYALEPYIKEAGRQLGVPLEWGGDWKTFPDAPHWQLPWKEYPA